MNKLNLAAAAVLMACAAPAAAADLTLDASSGFAIPIELRGHTLRLRVDLETPGHPILNPGAAARVGFRGSLFGARAVIGPVRLRGETNGSKFRIDGIEREHRFVWFDRDHVEGADGLISPHDLPYDNVTFRLRPEQPGEVTTSLVMDFSRSTGLHVPLAIGTARAFLQFSTLQPNTLATASFGALVAAERGGTWDGEPRDARIEFGVTRPVRPMQLATPLRLDSFAFDHLLVRTRDFRGDYQLPTDASEDPDEIVVTGERARQRARLYATVGLDRLSACSSLVYTRATRTLTMRCLPLEARPAA